MLKGIAAVALGAVLGACSDEHGLLPPDGPGQEWDGTVEISVRVPEMAAGTDTRSFGETPDLNQLKLHLMLFDSMGGFLRYMSEDDGTGQLTVTGVDTDNGVVTFKATLPYSSAPRTLHLVASQYDIGFAPQAEQFAMPVMSLEGDRDAYWQVVKLPSIGRQVPKKDENGNDIKDAYTYEMGDEVNRLKGVPLVRNFAKVTVAGDAVQHGEYGGFTVVNRPSKGTVVPYIASRGTEPYAFPEFCAPNADGTWTGVKAKDYTTLSATYSGWEMGDAVMTMTNEAELKAAGEISDDAAASSWNHGPIYLYEHPVHNVGNTFVVIRGRKTAQDPWSYYHIDLGSLNADGQVEVYNVLRNFHYEVTPSDIKGEGYPTVQDAIDGAASNNISYSTQTKSLTEVQNSAGDKITVEYSQKVYVDDEEAAVLKFCYTDPKKPVLAASDFGCIVYDNPRNVLVNDAGTSSLEPKTELTVEANTGSDKADWPFLVRYRVNTKNGRYHMGAGSATLRVYRHNGLGREVEIRVIAPVTFRTAPTETDPMNIALSLKKYGTTGVDFTDEMPAAHTATGYLATQEANINVHMALPADMPRACFPLKIVFESRRQYIYPNPVGGVLAVDQDYTTTFDGTGAVELQNMSVSKDPRMKYYYQIEYKDYDPKKGKTITVPFKFCGASVTGNTNNVSNKIDYIRVTNPYFETTDLRYQRN